MKLRPDQQAILFAASLPILGVILTALAIFFS